MKKPILFLAIFALVASTVLTSCSKDSMGDGPEGNETGGDEQGESGTRWTKTQTADEVINGIHAIIAFDAASNAFVGTFENLNSNVAQQTRLETHIFDANGNSTEFGPTPGVDMAPGETRSVTLSITTGVNFVEFTMHPEVGTAGSGG